MRELTQYQVPIYFYIDRETVEEAAKRAEVISDLIYKELGYDSDIGKVEERD